MMKNAEKNTSPCTHRSLEIRSVHLSIPAQPRAASRIHTNTMPHTDPAIFKMFRMRLISIAFASLSGGSM